MVSSLLQGHHNHHHSHHDLPTEKTLNQHESCEDNNNNKDNTYNTVTETTNNNNGNGVTKIADEEEEKLDDEDEISPCHCCSADPVRDLDRIQSMGARLDEQNEEQTNQVLPVDDDQMTQQAESKDDVESGAARTAEQKKIMRMSINTAIAIGLHNFPEGYMTISKMKVQLYYKSKHLPHISN